MSLDNADNGYWITETTTYKIHAESEAEAAKVWQEYWDYGTPWTELPMAIKDGGVEADWQWDMTIVQEEKND